MYRVTYVLVQYELRKDQSKETKVPLAEKSNLIDLSHEYTFHNNRIEYSPATFIRFGIEKHVSFGIISQIQKLNQQERDFFRALTGVERC